MLLQIYTSMKLELIQISDNFYDGYATEFVFNESLTSGLYLEVLAGGWDLDIWSLDVYFAAFLLIWLNLEWLIENCNGEKKCCIQSLFMYDQSNSFSFFGIFKAL